MRPVICYYYVTTRCNARCGFCDIWRADVVPASRESSPAVVSRNLGDLRLLGVRIVDFTGGEPLLYDGLPEVLAHARRIGLRTTVTTNGIRYLDRAAEMAGHVDILQFSLHGATSEDHDAVTVNRSFDRVMEAVDVARMLGERPTFSHTVTDANFERLPEVVAFARRLRVPLFLNPCFSYFGNDGLSRDRIRDLADLARGGGVTVDRGYLRFVLDGGNSRSAPRCMAMTSTVVISPDDRLLAPCYHRELRSFPIRGRLVALYGSPGVREERRREGRYPFCEGCAINCYVRASLYRRPGRYFLPSLFSAAEYLFELARHG